MKEYLKLLKWNRWEAVFGSGFFIDAGEASEPEWVCFAVVLMKDSDKMPLIIPS